MILGLPCNYLFKANKDYDYYDYDVRQAKPKTCGVYANLNKAKNHRK